MLRAAEAHYAYEQRATAAAVRAAETAWSQVSTADLDSSWAAVERRLLLSVVTAQLAAARDADPYLTASIEAQGYTDDPVAQLKPSGFIGMAGDGRPLDTLLAEPLIGVKQSIGNGVAPAQALESGGSRLAMLAATVVQDIGRSAEMAGLQTRPKVTGYVRVLTPPSCSRCTILAGRWYRKSTGFQRHPRCDCRMLASSEADAPAHTVNPYIAFARGEVRGLTKAEELAISEGSDVAQVVNARRGLARSGMTTSEGTSRRGLAGGRLQGRQRLTVEAIVRLSSDRNQLLRLLKAHGYIL